MRHYPVLSLYCAVHRVIGQSGRMKRSERIEQTRHPDPQPLPDRGRAALPECGASHCRQPSGPLSQWIWRWNFLNLCHAQTCGKCVPCRIGLAQLSNCFRTCWTARPRWGRCELIERTAEIIVDTADCAIGIEAARLVLMGVRGFRDDYEEHILRHRCLGSLKNPVPCVALCPAGVDIPGYIALVSEGRYADAVRLIRKDNPFPTTCAYICEHPCEARCRRNMVDDAVNVRGLKRFAVDNAGDVPNPPCARPPARPWPWWAAAPAACRRPITCPSWVTR